MQKNSNSKLRIAIVIVAIILLCVFCGSLLFILKVFGLLPAGADTPSNNSVSNSNITNSSNQTVSNNTVNNTTTNNGPVQQPTKIFVGNYVTATIPSDWSIKEYSDKTGMSMFVDTGSSTFSGLTGLEVLDNNNTVIFSLKGVDGIGGGDGCTVLPIFSDTEPGYIQSIKDITSSLGETTTVSNLSQKTYTNINMFNLRFRRVEKTLYAATGFDQTTFNTACGISMQLAIIDELGFTVKDGADKYTADAYKFKIEAQGANESTLQKLDAILNTLKSKSAS